MITPLFKNLPMALCLKNRNCLKRKMINVEINSVIFPVKWEIKRSKASKVFTMTSRDCRNLVWTTLTPHSLTLFSWIALGFLTTLFLNMVQESISTVKTTWNSVKDTLILRCFCCPSVLKKVEIKTDLKTLT